MRRLLLLLVMMALGVTQAVAAPMALCQHGDAASHHAALQSADAAIAADAHGEDSAAAAVDKQGAIDASGALVSAILPDQLDLPPVGTAAATLRPAPPGQLAGRSIPPLLDPPLA